MINAIAEKFSKKQADTPDPALQQSAATCSKCGRREFWRPRNQTEWRCSACQPPISKALIGAVRGQNSEVVTREFVRNVSASDPVVESSYVVTCCMPWCPACGCHQGREINWSDRTTEIRCRVCKAELPAWPEMTEPIHETIPATQETAK